MTAPSMDRSLSTVARLGDGVSAEYLEHAGVLPIARDGGTLTVATWRETVDPQVLDDLALVERGLPPARMQIAARELVGRYRNRPVT